MKQLILILSITVTFAACDAKTLQSALDALGATELTNSEIAGGLKQALEKGVGKSVSTLSLKDGFYKSAYKILMPSDAQKVINTLKVIPGFENIEKTIIQKVNQSAEDAAKKASPIFMNAIKGITFNDAMNILMGDNKAATNYLNAKTNRSLYNAFIPVIENSLNKFGALDYWKDAVTAYNKLPLVKDLNPDIKDHVTTKALSGLFSLIGKKEQGIRANISERSTDLLKKVFAKQDK